MFITFEGGEGCGKSTQSKMLYEYLASKGIDAILTREIGGTPVGEQIRDIVVNQELDRITEIFLAMAARKEHLNHVIMPALKANKWVICDRFIDSTAAYQAKDFSHMWEIYWLYKDFMQGLLPDKTFFIKVLPEVALSRIKDRKNNNKFEAKPLDFHEEVYAGFRCIANEMYPNRIVKIDAFDRSIEEVHLEILEYLKI